jgi:hypothetical protein
MIKWPWKANEASHGAEFPWEEALHPRVSEPFFR